MENFATRNHGNVAAGSSASQAGRKRPFTRVLAACLAVGVTFALGGCATVGGDSGPEETVQKRANERWGALVAGQFTKAYSYNTPGFRAVVSPDVYRGRTGSAVTWLGAEVVTVNCPEATKCNVVVRIDFKPALGGRTGDKFDTHVEEVWLQEDGQWWIFQSIRG